MEKLLKGVYTKCFVLEDSFKISHLSLGVDTPRITFKSHSHDFYQIVWIRKVCGQHTVNFQTREIADNSLFFIAPNVIHSAELFGENDIVYISFTKIVQKLSTIVYFCSFGLRSKYGLFDEALSAMAMVCEHPGSHGNVSDAQPAENSTRVSIRRSAATEQAEPMAMPTSMELRAHGFCAGFCPQAE